jgi:HEPN domain-containing protein
MVHWGTATLPFEAEELAEEKIEALGVMLTRDNYSDPFGLATERMRVARRSYEMEGDYTSVVVHSYTGCEVLLNSVLLLMAWEEGTSRAKTRNWFEGQQGFMARILTQLPPRLGGNWSTQPEDAVVNRLKRLADTRHQVVHYGHLPDEREAQEAIESTDAVMEYVKVRLVVKRNHYPRTALMMLGQPGMQRLGVPVSWVERFMRTKGNTE